VYGSGTEPDPRFTFANERTFLAWIRTALALLIAGVATHAVEQDLGPVATRAAAAALLLMGVACSGAAFGHWMRSERALRQQLPLTLPRLAPLMAYAVAAISLVLLLTVILSS
jgi:putative membrane protein